MIRLILGIFLSVVGAGAFAQTPNGGGAMVPSSPSTLGPIVSNFGGLQFAIAPGSIGNPGGTMTGYAQGDVITLQCAGVTFATSPAITVNQASGGTVTGATLTNFGITSGSTSSGAVACTQASTTGTGTGYTVTAQLGVIASNLSFTSLATGGGVTNGNVFLGSNTPSASGIGGAENVFVGDYAGGAFTGTATANTAVGHDACGIFGAIAPAGNYNTCLGDDAGRNISGTATASNTLVGQGAGENVSANGNTAVGASAMIGSSTFSGTFNTVVGYLALQGAGLTTGQGNTAIGQGALQAATTTASFNVAVGYNAGKTITTGSNNLCLGTSACDANITTGARNIVIGTNGCDVGSAGANDNFIVCESGGHTPIFSSSNINTATPAWLIAGTLKISSGFTVSTLPASPGQGTRAYVTDATSCTFLGALTGGGSTYCPVNYNGSAWVGG